jgi:sporulation protein YlmC with PRC-barrel domain
VGAVIRLTDLRDATVRTLDGKRLGRVHEVHADGGRIVALHCGAGSFVERLTAKTHGHRIPWENVCRIADGEIVVSLDAAKAKRGKNATAARSRQGTRRPSGPRSKR